MKRFRSLNLCDSGIDQTTCQLNEVAHMYADRQVYRKLQEFPFYFMGVFRLKAFEITAFPKAFLEGTASSNFSAVSVYVRSV